MLIFRRVEVVKTMMTAWFKWNEKCLVVKNLPSQLRGCAMTPIVYVIHKISGNQHHVTDTVGEAEYSDSNVLEAEYSDSTERLIATYDSLELWQSLLRC
jgi:hypothetical protein